MLNPIVTKTTKELRYILSRCDLPPRARMKLEKVTSALEDAVAAEAKPSFLQRHKGALVTLAVIAVEVVLRFAGSREPPPVEPSKVAQREWSAVTAE